MKIITLGNGFIAGELPYEIVSDRLQADEVQIRNLIYKYNPDVIVNCIAYTGIKNIDDCEINKEKTLLSNLTIPTILANECHKLGIHFVQLASGCIYYGPSPNIFGWGTTGYSIAVDEGWKETDHANPLSYYSRTKYAADLAIGNLPNVTTLRLRMPISSKNHPRNLINKLLNYQNVVETLNSVTFIDELISVIDWAIQEEKMGIYHVANPEPITHSQILEEYRKYFPNHQYNKITTDQLNDYIKAPRSNCILDTTKLQEAGFKMSPTKQALENCMKDYVFNIKKQ